MTYPQLLEEAPDRGIRPAVQTPFTEQLDLAAAAVILEHLDRARSWLRLVQLRVLGGAIGRVADDETAYAHRQSKILVTELHGDQPDPAWAQTWARDVAGNLCRGDRGAYVNFLGPEEFSRFGSAYPPSTLARLRRIKAAYDPTNLFRHNVNITQLTVGRS